MELYVKNYEELKEVENFLFRFIYPKSFCLQIIVGHKEQFNYITKYNSLANGLILETI